MLTKVFKVLNHNLMVTNKSICNFINDFIIISTYFILFVIWKGATNFWVTKLLTRGIEYNKCSSGNGRHILIGTYNYNKAINRWCVCECKKSIFTNDNPHRRCLFELSIGITLTYKRIVTKSTLSAVTKRENRQCFY